MRRAADTPAGVAESKGKFTAFALDADISALLRKGAAEALGGQLDFARDSLALRRHGALIPIRINRTGRCFLSVIASVKDA